MGLISELVQFLNSMLKTFMDRKNVNYQVKLYTNDTVKLIGVPPRPIQYHLKARVDDAIESMISEGVIEEHPPNETAPWVSCAVIVTKSDSSFRITLDARNLNKALISDNYPLPSQENVRPQLSGLNYFSKLDLKAAFWQLELDTESHVNNKLYRYTRLIMGVKPVQVKLSAISQTFI